MNQLPDETYLTVDDVAEYLKIGKSTVYRLIHDGQLKAIRIQSSYRVALSSVLAFLQKPIEPPLSSTKQYNKMGKLKDSERKIATKIRSDIENGKYQYGAHLLSIAKLATKLNIPTSGVVRIYNDLKKTGHVRSETPKGYFVSWKPEDGT